MQRRTLCGGQEQFACPSPTHSLEGGNRFGHRIADHQHPRTGPRRFYGVAGRRFRRHGGNKGYGDTFFCRRFSAAVCRCWRILAPYCRIGRFDGLLKGGFCSVPQPFRPRHRSQCGGHQHGVTPAPDMHVKQPFLHLCHIAIGGVNLVDHQQAARQRRRAQMGVLDLQGGQHGLIDRAHGNRCGQRSLDAFRRPAGHKRRFVGAIVVIPAHLPVGQPLPFGLAGLEIAGHGQNRLRRAVAEQAPHGVVDPLLNLDGRGARGQREVKAVNQPGLKKLSKAPERRLGLAGTGFGLQDHQR